MRRPRWQKVLADLWGNRTRSLLVVASIAVGLFALGVMAAIYAVALEDLQRGYAAVNPANIAIQTSLFSQGLVERLQQVEGVQDAQGVRLYSTRLLVPPDEWIAVDIQAFHEPANPTVNRLVLIEGNMPTSKDQIVIDRYRFADTKARLGDQITVELRSGRTRKLTLVGIVQDQTIGAFRGAGGFFNAPVQGYVNQETMESLEQPLPKRYNSLYLTVEGNSADPIYLEEVAREVRRVLEDNQVQIVSTALRSSTDHPNLYLARALLAVLIVIGFFVVFLSGFLITNTLQALINQQVAQIGIMKSVGGRRVQIAGIYLLLNLVYGLLAFLIAMPLSFQVAFWVVDYLTVQMNSSFFGYRLLPEVIILEAVIAVLMPQFAALPPVWQGTRISVQEALSGIRQDHPPHQGWLDRRISRLRNTSLLLVISLRNTFRRKGRLLLTVLTLSLGGAVFIATFNVRVSLLNYVDQIIRYFLADVNITLDRPYRIDEVAALVQQVPGVKMVEGWAFARTELVKADGSVGESVALLAPPAESPLVQPILLEGRWINAGDQNAIALSELFRERFPNLRVGDTIRLQVNGDETDWVIVGFYQLAGKISGLAAYTSYESLAKLTHQSGRSIAYRVVSVRPGLSQSEQQALGKAVEQHLERAGITVVDMTTGKDLYENAAEGFDVLTAFLLFLSLLTALVGSIGLTGTMSLNVMERTREVGVLRAIGASDRILMRMVLLEGAVIGLVSWVLASLAALPISKLMSDAISQALFGGPANFGYTPLGFMVWLAAVVLLSISASIMPARNATRLTIREVLAYE